VLFIKMMNIHMDTQKSFFDFSYEYMQEYTDCVKKAHESCRKFPSNHVVVGCLEKLRREVNKCEEILMLMNELKTLIGPRITYGNYSDKEESASWSTIMSEIGDEVGPDSILQELKKQVGRKNTNARNK
jgi:hypothetical protein